MQTVGSGINKEQLRHLYNSEKVAKALFDDFALRERNKKESTVDRLRDILTNGGYNASRGEVIRFLKRLASLGCCVFKTGRRKHPSRARWNVSLVSLGRVASGQSQEFEEVRPDEAEESETGISQAEPSSNTMRVTYPLRPDLLLEISPVPKNMTAREAQRLADFIKTLPFDDAAAA